jgi:hypothetical protein
MADSNYIAKELDQEELNIIKEYADKGKLHPDWFPLTTYDMVQSGYPTSNHGAMIADPWGGTDGDGRLLPSTGMWCKVEDVKNYLKTNGGITIDS